MGRSLPTKIEFFNQRFILFTVRCTEVIEKTAAAADELQQSLTRPKVFTMGLKMARELIDSFGDEGDLDGRAARICGMGFLLVDGRFCSFFG